MAGLKLRVIPSGTERIRAEAVRPLRPLEEADLHEQPNRDGEGREDGGGRQRIPQLPLFLGTAMATTIRITATTMTKICHKSHQPVRSRSCSRLTLSAKAIQALTSPTTEMARPEDDRSGSKVWVIRVDDGLAGGACERLRGSQ